MFGAEEDQLVVLLEKLRSIEVEPTIVALLVEIHRTDLQLNVFKVGCDIDDEVIGPHVTQQTDETALVELYQLLGNTDRFEPFAV